MSDSFKTREGETVEVGRTHARVQIRTVCCESEVEFVMCTDLCQCTWKCPVCGLDRPDVTGLEEAAPSSAVVKHAAQ